jgi:hypothetical protein
LIIVDFPAPFGPKIPKILPLGISKFISSIAFLVPDFKK